MAHDFREMLGERLHGGSVSVLAFALLFLPIFLWLGPLWLVFYWFIIFFGYAKIGERIADRRPLAAAGGARRCALDLASHWIAGRRQPGRRCPPSPATSGAIEPDALRRMQELVNIVPDDAMLHLLLGNLYLQDGNEQQASQHYRRSAELHDNAGAHVNLGNLHFFNNDFATAVTEYNKAEELDPQLAIAFYDDSIALGELYKFDEQAQKLDQAKKIDRVAHRAPHLRRRRAQKVGRLYHPPIAQAWTVSSDIARRGVARSLFGNYAWFDPLESVRNPLTLGAILTLLLAPLLFLKRRRSGIRRRLHQVRTDVLPSLQVGAREHDVLHAMHPHLPEARRRFDGHEARQARRSQRAPGRHADAQSLAGHLPARLGAGHRGAHGRRHDRRRSSFVFFVSLAILSGTARAGSRRRATRPRCSSASWPSFSPPCSGSSCTLPVYRRTRSSMRLVMALEGTLKDFSLADIFQLIGLQRKTGVLTLRGKDDTVTVTFLDGKVVGADSLSHRLENRLGHVLIRERAADAGPAQPRARDPERDAAAPRLHPRSLRHHLGRLAQAGASSSRSSRSSSASSAGKTATTTSRRRRRSSTTAITSFRSAPSRS